jgi:hypothetical protein
VLSEYAAMPPPTILLLLLFHPENESNEPTSTNFESFKTSLMCTTVLQLKICDLFPGETFNVLAPEFYI